MPLHPKKIAEVFGRFQMGFQDQQISPVLASVIFVFSMVQFVGTTISIHLPTSNIFILQKFFVPASFLIFLDYNYLHDPVGPLFVFHVLFFCLFLMTTGSIFWARRLQGLDKQFRAEDHLPGSHFVLMFGVLFVPCLLTPLIESSLVLFFCWSFSPENQIAQMTRMMFAFCTSPQTNLVMLTRVLGAANLILGFLWTVALIAFVVPRNEVPDNAIHSQSRLYDTLSAFQRVIGGLTFSLQLTDSLSLRVCVMVFLVLTTAGQGHLVLTRTTFAHPYTTKIAQFCSINIVLLCLCQALWMVWSFFRPTSDFLSPIHVLAIVGVLALLAWKLIDRRLVGMITASLNTEMLTQDSLHGLYQLLLFIREKRSVTLFDTEKTGSSEEDRVNMHTFQHFMECRQTECICPVLSRHQEIWDTRSKSYLHISEDGATDSIVQLVSDPAFIRALVRNRIDRLLKFHKGSFAVNFFHLQLAIWEELNFILASCSFANLNERRLGFLEGYDIEQFQRVFRSRVITNFDHHATCGSYLNVDKFVRASLQLEKMEEDLLEFLVTLLDLLKCLGQETLEPESRAERVQHLLTLLSNQVGGLKKTFAGSLPNRQAYLFASFFHQSVRPNRAKATQLLIALKMRTKAMLSKTLLPTVCAFKRFFFDFQKSAVLSVDMDSSPAGKILWDSPESETFFGHPQADFKRSYIRRLLTHRLARDHKLMYLGFLNGFPSRKVMSMGELVFKKANGFFDRKETSIKPFFYSTTAQLTYFTYAETPEGAPPLFLRTDHLGFIEGVSQTLAAYLKIRRAPEVSAQALTLLHYFPGLVDFCFVACEEFRGIFQRVEKFEPIGFIEFEGDYRLCSYNVSAVLTDLPAPRRHLLDTLASQLRSPKTPLHFPTFRKQLFELSASVKPVFTFWFRARISRPGGTRPILSLEVVSIRRDQGSEPHLPTSDSHLLPASNFGWETGRLWVENLGEDLYPGEEKNRWEKDPAVGGDSSQDFPLPSVPGKKFDILGMEQSKPPSKILGVETQQLEVPQAVQKLTSAPTTQFADFQSHLQSASHTSRKQGGNQTFQQKCPLLNRATSRATQPTLEEFKRAYSSSSEDSQSGFKGAGIPSSALDGSESSAKQPGQIDSFKHRDSPQPKGPHEDRDTVEEKESSAGSQKNSDPQNRVAFPPEGTDHAVKAIRNRFKHREGCLTHVILISTTPILLSLGLGVAFSFIFTKWFEGPVVLNSDSNFYITQWEVLAQQITAVPMLALAPSEDISNALMWQYKVVNSAAVATHNRLYSSKYDPEVTIFQYFKDNFVVLQYFNWGQAVSMDRIFFPSVISAPIDVARVIARYLELPFTNNAPIPFWANLFPFLASSGVFLLVIFLWITMKLRLSNQD